MTDIAKLGLEIDSTSADRATTALNNMAEAGKRAEERAKSLGLEGENAAAYIKYKTMEASQAYYAQADSVEVVSKSMQRLLATYDPLGAKLRQLTSQQAEFRDALKGGMTGITDDAIMKAEQGLNAEIGKTKALMEAAAAGTSSHSSALSALGINSQYARRELMTLGREIMEGNFSRAPATFGSLVAHSNILGALLSPMALGIAAVGASVIALAAAYVTGQKEQNEMAKAIQLTGNFAGVTTQSMRDMAIAMSASGDITIGKSKAIVTALVDSGRIASDSIGSISRLSADYASATNKDITKLGPDLVKLFEDPAKGAKVLNEQMHFLTSAQIEYINHLQRTGELGQAQLALANATAVALPKVSDNLGTLERAWNSVKSAAANAWDAMQGVGRTKTLAEQIAEAQAQIAALQNMPRANPAKVAAAQGNLDQLTAAQYSAGEAAAYNQAKAEGNRLGNQAGDLVNSVSQYAKIADLTDKIALAHKFVATTSDEILRKNNAIYDLEKQRADAQRSIGADYRALMDARFNGEAAIAQQQNNGAKDQIETLFKLGQITQQQRDQMMKGAELEAIGIKQNNLLRQQALGGLAPQQAERIKQELALLEAEKAVVGIKYDNMDRIERLKITQMQVDADAKSAAATVSQQMAAIDGLDTQIAAARLHNEEIGKTKAQVDALKAAEIDRQISRLEYDRTMNEDDVAYIARLDQQIGKLRELQNIERQGAQMQAQSDQIKKQTADWNKMWTSVEAQGKAAFVAVLSHGKNAFESIGAALKASVIDLLYELTLKSFMVNIGLNIAQSMGMNVASSAAGSAAGSLFGGGGGIMNGLGAANSAYGIATGGGLWGTSAAYSTAVPGLTMGGGQAAFLAEQTGAFGASGLAATAEAGGSALAAGGAGGLMAGIGTAMPYIGAAMLAYSLLGGGGGPKQQDLYWNGGNFGADNITSQDPAFYNKVNAYTGQIRADYTPDQLSALNGIHVSAAAGSDENQLFAQLQQAVASALQGVKSISQTKAETDAYNKSIDATRNALLAAKDPLGYWTGQVRSLQSTLGTSVSTVEEWRNAFLSALDASPDQATFTAWQNLGGALDQVAKAVGATTGTMDSLTKATAALDENLYATLVDFTRAQRLQANGIDVSSMAIPHFASGGSHAGGWRVVGDGGGPELEYTAPSHIYTSAQASGLIDLTPLLNEISNLRSDLREGQDAVAGIGVRVEKMMKRWDGTAVPGLRTDDTAVRVNVTASVPVPVA